MAETARLGREPIDGRPLYQYGVDLEHLAALEVLINHPCSTESQQILALAPVAAARFASNYDENVPSWAHCGTEVERLYKTHPSRFRVLMDASFSRYRVPIVRRPGADLLFETVIGQAGLPSGMLRPGRVLRRVLDELMKKAAVGSADLLADASRLIVDALDQGDGRHGPRLRRAYQEAGHLPKLCVALVAAIIRLTERAGWSGGPLDPLWALPDWDRELPFRVDQGAARDIVSQLLDVAVTAAGASGMAIERVLSSKVGEWSLSTWAAVPAGGIELFEDLPDLLAVHYTVSDEPIGEACHLRKREGSRYFLARAVQELSENALDRTIQLAVHSADGYRPVDCAGGEPLEGDSAWVFEARAGGYVYRAPAPVRLRASELLVAARAGTNVTGDAVALERALVIKGEERTLWKVTGKALITDHDGEQAVVEAGYRGPQAYLDFKGRSPAFKVHGFSAAFLGNPDPRRLGGLSGRIEWRREGATTWTHGPLRNAAGLLAYRLVDSDGEVVAERRRVFVFPEGFRPEVSSKSVSFQLPSDFAVEGAVPSNDGVCVFDFGSSSHLQIRLRSPAGTDVTLTFDKPTPASFIDLATGEETSSGRRRVSAPAATRIRAHSELHDRVEILRKSDRWSDVHPLGLKNNRLSLADLRGFLQALAFHPRGRTHGLSVQFQNGPAIDIDAYRICRADNTLTIPGADSNVHVQLRPLVASSDKQAKVHFELERIDAETWKLPDLSADNTIYLAVDMTHQAAPCLVLSGSAPNAEDNSFLEAIAIGDEVDRRQALARIYERIASDPHEGIASAQLDICLGWLADFQFELAWLDPFLVLAERPELAIKILALTRIRGREEAQQGLQSELDKVPFFWHRVTGRMLNELLGWVEHHYGEREKQAIAGLLDELPLPKRMRKPQAMQAVHDAWRDEWQMRVIDWAGAQGWDLDMRTSAMGAAAESLWRQLENTDVTQRLIMRPRAIPDAVSIFRTYLAAPYELAVATARGIDMDAQFIDNLLYARHAIATEQFDNAYCTGLALLESS